MAIESFGTERAARKLRMGMVGGGRGAFIGAVRDARVSHEFQTRRGTGMNNAVNL
jgi:hypothetical protein